MTTETSFLEHQPELERELGEEVSISGVAHDFRIFQRKRGHRHSIDDALTGWYALQKKPDAGRALDLGSGVGSVGLTVLSGLSETATMVCIEAQAISYALLKANISCNGLAVRVATLHGDIREIDLGERFDLVTGSPPYFPIGTGILPPDSQKAHARFELRGHVGDYATVARRHLTDTGIFVFCFPFQQQQRCIELVSKAGLFIRSIRDVIPRAGRPALFSLYSAVLGDSALAASQSVDIETPFIVADEHGRHTEEMIAMQRSRGFGPDGTNG